MHVLRIGTSFQLSFEEVFCFQEGCSRAGFVLKRLSRKANEKIFPTRVLLELVEEIVRQTFGFVQSVFIFPSQKTNVSARADGPKILIAGHLEGYHVCK